MSEPVRYSWQQIYQMPDGSVHWALCDTESEKQGKVSCAYMVLLADHATGVDGQRVGDQPMLKRIVRLLNEEEEKNHEHRRKTQEAG